MIIKEESLPKSVAVRVEEFAIRSGKSWEDAVIFLLSKGVDTLAGESAT